MKEELKIVGEVHSYSGLPVELIEKYGEEWVEGLKKNNPDIKIEDFFSKSKIHHVDSNLILDQGKKMIFYKLFGKNFNSQEVIFNKMIIGDGGHAFDVSGEPSAMPVFPAHSDTSLNNFIIGKNVDFVSDFSGNYDQGFEKSIVCSFFSHIDTDFNTVFSTNNLNKFVNETAICMTEIGGAYSNLLCKHVMRNFAFRVVDAIALTIEWVIRVL